jgi:glycine cleavage system H protein
MRANTKRCPLLKDEKVIYCKNSRLRKMLPVEKIFELENLCLKDTYRNCPLYEEQKVNVQGDLSICPFVGFEIISFCMAFPVKKIVANHVMTSPCTTGGYEACPIYRNLLGRRSEAGFINHKGFLIDGRKEYLENHMWLEKHNGTVRVGLTDFAQYLLGEIESVGLRSRGERIGPSDPLVKIEVHEGFFELYAPISGKIVDVNEGLNDFPKIINVDPYGSGWIADIALENTPLTIDPEKAIGLLERDLLRFQKIVEEIRDPNMQDGGEFVKDLRGKIEDIKKVRRLVRELLNGKEV